MKSVIIALDFADRQETMAFLRPFRDEKPFVKIGMELFYAEGADIVREIKDLGYPIFLDLKVHDIPHTAESAMRQLHRLQVDMTNVHAAGGSAMMRAAREGYPDGILLAVTQLTSTSQEAMNRELGIAGAINDVIVQYASLAKASGLNGVVCSPLESPMVHKALGDAFLTVTPGIRFAEGSKDDQKRVTTPEMAQRLGSNYIVVGRSITKADDPVAAYHQALAAFRGKADE